MAAWNKTTIKKYINAIKKEKKKIVTCETLSYVIGVYPEVIAEALSKYDPLIPMDYEYNLMTILPLLEKDLSEMESQTPKKEKGIRITKKEMEQYDSLSSFVYAKMTTAGLVNRDIVLSDKDLKMMKRLIVKEEQERKKNRKMKK